MTEGGKVNDLVFNGHAFSPGHCNPDGMQSQATSQHNTSINLPILHLPQLLGLAMGLGPMLPSRHTRGLWRVSIFAIEDRRRDTGWIPANGLRE